MAAGEDQPQLIVRDRRQLERVLGATSLLFEAQRKGQLAALRLDDLQVPQSVESLAPTGRGEPRARGGRQAVLGPGLEGGGERILKRILGELKVAEDTDQRRQNRAGLCSKDLIESARGLAHLGLYI